MGKMPCKKGAFLFSALEMVTGLNKDADRILQVADKTNSSSLFGTTFHSGLDGGACCYPFVSAGLPGALGSCPYSHRTMLFSDCSKTKGIPQWVIYF